MIHETEVYDRDAAPGEARIVTKSELARRQAERNKGKPGLRYELPEFPERGSWVYDRKLCRVVERNADYYARNPRPMQRSHGIQVIPDIPEYKSMHDGSRIGGRRQHREHLRQHGLIEYGNDMPQFEPEPLPPVEQDIKDAYDIVQAGHKPPPLDTYSDID